VKRHIKGPCLTRSRPWTHASNYLRGTVSNALPTDISFEELKRSMDEAMAIAHPRMFFWSKVQDPDKW